jgi:hypothetical protein
MILAFIAFITLKWQDQITDHKVLFIVFFGISILDLLLKWGVRATTATWPDGTVDHGKSAPISKTLASILGISIPIRYILFLWLMIAAFI